jgi:hypothetical protein
MKKHGLSLLGQVCYIKKINKIMLLMRERRRMALKALTKQEVEQFMEVGWVRLEQAFAREDALADQFCHGCRSAVGCSPERMAL